MKQNLLATRWSQINRLWQSETGSTGEDIRVPTPEQQKRAKLALQRLREIGKELRANGVTAGETQRWVREGLR